MRTRATPEASARQHGKAPRSPRADNSAPQELRSRLRRGPNVGIRVARGWGSPLVALRRLVGCCSRPRVSFKGTVQVIRFSPSVGGGGGVPTDGSLVSLGLGRRTRGPAVSERLAKRCCRHTQPHFPRWIPPLQRVRLLRRSLGDAKCFRSMSEQRVELRRLLKRRRESVEDPKELYMMPTSIDDGRSRALRLAAEVHDCRRKNTASLRAPLSPQRTPSPVAKPASLYDCRGCGSVAEEPRAAKRMKLDEAHAPGFALGSA